ncbi:Leucine-rich repeat-containing protein 66 [Merluccius polli]|uniref:Leucine-rich repeat-containing protein 66 n=1 Tax=Merluccius polli TaxID=89951 RepID=A0AA47MW35_MERPO|nr:Leucine-rich repeat-containing protein 66 [Merluccius polli]
MGGGQSRANSRLPRSLPGDSRGIGSAVLSSGQVRTANNSGNELGVAVGLSVFFTFLVAFILGVFARPCIDALWRKVCGKKNASSQPGSVSSAGQGPHDNQAYSDEEDDPETVSHRERRVTFSTPDNQEQSRVDYYDTLASGHLQNLPHTRHQSGEARGRNSLEDRRIAANSEPTLSQEFEHIPDDNELGERRSLSSSDEEQDNSTRKQKKSRKASSSQPIEDSIQQKSDSAFTNRSPHLNDTKLMEQDQSIDSGEAFDFPESIQSGSARSSSLFGSFNHSKKTVFLPSNDLRHSSSSSVSGDDSTLYTVNPDTEEWERVEMAQDVQNIHDAKMWEGKLQNAKMAPDHSDSSHSSSCNSDDEVTEYTFNQEAAVEDEGTGRISKSYSYSSSSASESEMSEHKIVRNASPKQEAQSLPPNIYPSSIIQGQITEQKMVKQEWDLESSPKDIDAQNNTWPKLCLNNITGIKRRLDIKVATETTGPAVTLKDTDQDYRYHVKPHPDVKETTDFTSSSSESEEETRGPAVNVDDTHVKTEVENAYQPHLHLGTVSPIKDFEINAQEDRWPKLDLNNVTGIKRRLDIKVATPSPDVTSSIGERGEDDHWPKLDLNNVTGIKRRLDIKVATETTGPAVTLKDTDQDYRYHVKPHPDIKATTDFTSSSSESEEETRGPAVNVDDTHVKTEVENAYQPHLHLGTVSPIKDFEINAQEDRWPKLDLNNVTGIKRRLDIKVATPSPDVTSSIGERGEDDHWPKLDLNNVTGIKRRLDIKVATETTGPAVTLKDTDQDYRYHVKPHPDIKATTDFTSSSSESEEETRGPAVNVDDTHVKTEVENAYQPHLHLGTVSPIKDFEINAQEDRWPKLDLNNVTGIKRRLDIKVATPSPDVTSSIGERGEDDHWPKLDLNNVTGIKRRLDIKVATETTGPAVTLKDTDQDYRYHVKPHPDIKATTDFTSSSSESEEETRGPAVNVDDAHVKTEVENAYQPHLHLGTVSPIKDFEINAQEDRWPKLDLNNVTGIKRRLDIKVAMPSLDVTSSIGERGEDDHWPKLDLNNVTGIKRRLDIKVATETTGPAVTLKDTDQDYRYHVKPHPDIKATTDFTSSSSESEEETRGPAVNVDDTQVKTEVENAYKPHLHLGTVSPIKDFEINAQEDRWPKLDLNVTGIKRRLDIKVATPSPDVTSSIGERGEDDHWPKLDLNNVTGIKRRLDIKVATETTGPAVTLKDTDQDYRHHVKPYPDIEATTDFTSSSSESEEETRGPAVNVDDPHMKTEVENAYQPHLHLGTVSPIKDFEINAQEDRWPKLDLNNVTGIKRRLDIKVAMPSPDVTSSIGERGEDDHWPKLDLNNITGIKRRLDIKVATETTGPAVTLKDTDQDYRHHVKPYPDIEATTDFTSSSSESEEETRGPAVNVDYTHMKTEVENAYQPHLHLGTVSPIKDFEINAQEDRWPKLDLNNVTGIKRRLDIKVATETMSPAVTLKDTDQDYRYHVKTHPDIHASTNFTSSSSESEEETRGTVVNLDDAHVKTKLGNAYQPHLLDLNVTGIKRRLDIKIATPSLDITSGIGERGEDDRWPLVDLSRVTGIKRHVDIKVATKTTCPAVTLKDTDQDYRYHVKPHQDIKATDFTSSSSESEEEARGPTVNLDNVYVKTKVENAYQPHLHMGTVEPNKDFEINAQEDRGLELDLSNITGIKRRLDIKIATPSPDITSSIGERGEDDRWPMLDYNVTGIKRRLDIKVATETTGPAVTLKDPDQDYRYHVKPHQDIKASTDFTFSSSDSEEETRSLAVNVDDTYVKTKVEDAYQPHLHLGTVKPIKDTEINAINDRWPELDLSWIPHIKRRLDVKASTETPGSPVTLDDTDEYRWSRLDLSNVTRVKRRLDIKAPMPSPEMTSSDSRVPPQSRFSSSSSDSESEVKVQMVKQEREGPVVGTMSQIRWPDLKPRVPRIKRRLDVKAPSPLPYPGKVDLVPFQHDTGSSTSESEDKKPLHTGQPESEVHVLSPTTKNDSILHFKGPLNDNSLTLMTDPIIKLEKYAVITDRLGDKTTGSKSIPGPDVTPDLESHWAGLNLGMPHFRKRLDISANEAGLLKVSSETEMLSSHGKRVDKGKGWDLKRSAIKELEIDEQNKTWPLMDLRNVTGIKRRLDFKVATPSPDLTSSSHESGGDDRWPKLDLDNVTSIKRRLDIKAATLPSNTSKKYLSIEDRWKMQSRDVRPPLDAPPPVPDCSPPDSFPSSESEDDAKRVSEGTDFTEYRTHGPARSFAPSVRATSDTEVASSFKTGDEKGWSSVTVDTRKRERKGLGALRAMSSERKRWDHEELADEGSSQHNRFQGLALRDAPSLNLEPHTSIVSVQEARTPGRLPRSLQRAKYHDRLMGRYVEGEDTKDDLRHPPEYSGLQNSTLFDSSNPLTEV